jgi:hypothetical protein
VGFKFLKEIDKKLPIICGDVPGNAPTGSLGPFWTKEFWGNPSENAQRVLETF